MKTIRRRKIKKGKKSKKRINKNKRKYIKKQKGGAPGIKITDTIITSLSGPISFYYLKPKEDIDPSEFEYFPLIILFGDWHDSKEGSCLNCTCSKEEEGKCCYTISDHTFLQLLDTLGDNDNPIDFYTETFLAGSDFINTDDYLSELTSEEMVMCYQRTLRGTEYNKCPTKNIRWQATDARVAGDTFNKVDGEYKYRLSNETFQELLDNDKKFIDTVSKKFRDDVYIEFQITALLTNLMYIFNYLRVNKIDDIDEEASDLIDNFNHLLSISTFKTIDNFMDLLKTLYNKETNSFDFDTFSNTLFSMMTRDNSLIYKQIMKQEYPLFKNIKYWWKFYTQILTNNYTDFTIADLVYILDNLEYVMDFINEQEGDDDDLVEYEYDIQPRIEILCHALEKLRMLVGVPFVDIYTLTRILKKPEGGNRSSLSFGYFGNQHVKNMVELLLATNKYTLVHSVSNKEDKIRCLEFDFSLDLDAEVKEHNELIK